MGINFGLFEQLEARGIFGDGRIRLLDIGSSNLYQATATQVEAVLRRFRVSDPPGEVAAFCERLAKGSEYTAEHGGRNEAFAGELFERMGMEYLSFDIARGYKTEIVDLNTADLPPQYARAFDVVLNIGTTEHVLNQFNSFKVIHEAARPGGYIVHQLPVAGFTDHGYFVYTGRMFFELASFNKYEIVDLWYDGPAGDDRVTTSVDSYRAHFASLAKAYTSPEREQALRAIAVPNVALTIIFRKTADTAFSACLETSTSVGQIPASVSAAYSNSALGKATLVARHSAAAGLARRIVRKLTGR